MSMNRLLFLLSLAFTPFIGAQAGPLVLGKDDHICLIGNTLPERMQHFGYFESLVHARYPEHQLVVRNLGFSADELELRSRSLDFGDADHHLTKEKADVILAFFGLNESFDGEGGLERFAIQLDTFIKDTLGKKFNGKTAPRLAIVSPIAYEGGGGRPSDREVNRQLSLYTDVMRATTVEYPSVTFVDLFEPTLELLAPKGDLTENGIHLTEDGYAKLAPMLDQGLFGAEGAAAKVDEKLRAEVNEKNFQYFHRYRAVNGYYIYGGRSKLRFDPDKSFTNADVMERERQVLDEMCANRDQRIWAVAQGKEVSEEIDDSNVSPFIEVKSNFGSGSNDGKEGSVAYLKPEETLKKLTLGRGYVANVFASEVEFPEIANCVQMAFDSAGKLWVCCMPMYQGYRPGEPMTDKIVVLEDTDGDGKADKSTLFADDLHVPTGFEVGDGGVYVAQQPDVMFLKDTDGDGKADYRKRILHGFDSGDSHHSISTFTWGPGGGLYLHEGTFHHTSVETPWGPVRNAHGAIYRFDPTRKQLETFVSYNFANPWGHCFDEWGQNFVADASGGANYWGTAFSSRAVPYEGQEDFGPFKFTTRAQLKQFIKKRVRPTSGIEVVSSHHFPQNVQGNLLLNNCIGFLGVLQHKVYDDGSGFRGEEVEPILQSADGNFRPVDFEFGPDGALYIVDWHNALVGHMQHNVRDPNRDKTHGRIWRVTYPARPLATPPRIAGESIVNLLEVLKDPIIRTRHHARMELRLHPKKEVVKALGAWVGRLDANDPDYEHHMLEALWVHQHHHSVNCGLLEKILNAKDPRARAAATRVISFWRDGLRRPLDLLHPRIGDSHPRVRAEALRAVSYVDSKAAASLALDVLDHPMDDYLDYLLNETMRVLDKHLTVELADGSMQASVLLDKGGKMVDYQLGRLKVDELLALNRDATNPRYEPIHEAILKRPGMVLAERESAVAALARSNKTDVATELVRIIRGLDAAKANGALIVDIGKMLFNLDGGLLLNQRPALERLAKGGKTASGRQMAYATLMNSRFMDEALVIAGDDSKRLSDLLGAVSAMDSEEALGKIYGNVFSFLNSQDVALREAAIGASTSFTGHGEEVFAKLVRLLESDTSTHAVIKALHRMHSYYWHQGKLPDVARKILTVAEGIPVGDRNKAPFLDAIQLVQEMSKRFKKRTDISEQIAKLRVPVVRIGTVKHQLKFDKTEFTVEAGKEIEIIFENSDTLPHNLLLAHPGALEEVGALADKMALQPDGMSKHFIPDSPKVLKSTKLLQEGNSETLKIKAPETKGDYLYICTFPGHWRTMYGKMIVK
jgi:putative membrane-bound dehydrogenase-like protein